MMRNGVARMSELINNVLDLTQARLGGGFQLNRANEGGLGPVLEQVIAEQRFARPDRAIEMECKLDEPINCDRARVAQLFSNLIRLNLVSAGASNIATRKLGLDRANRVAWIDSDPDNTTAFLAESGDAIEKRTREFVPDSDLLQVEQV